MLGPCWSVTPSVIREYFFSFPVVSASELFSAARVEGPYGIIVFVFFLFDQGRPFMKF